MNFVVQVGAKIWGPFETADAAVKWVENNVNESEHWIIVPVREAK